MRAGKYQLSVLQLLLLTALCALLAGVGAHARRQSGADEPSCLAFSPDGKQLLACSFDGQVTIWNLTAASARERRLSLEGVDAAGWPVHRGLLDRDVFASLSYNSSASRWELCVWDLHNGRRLRMIPLPSYPADLAMSDERRIAATTSWTPNPSCELWDLNTGAALQMPAIPSNIAHVALSADGQVLAGIPLPTVGSQQPVHVWRLADGSLIRTIAPESYPFDLTLSRDGNRLAVLTRGTAEIWDLQQDLRLSRIALGSAYFEGVFSPDGQTFITDERVTRRLCVWNADTGQLRGELALPGLWGVRSGCGVACSPDGRLLAAAGPHWISLWDLTTLEHVRDLRRDWRLATVCLYSLGFLVWSVAWGFVARRSPSLPVAASAPPEEPPPRVFRVALHPWQMWIAFALLSLIVGAMWAWIFAPWRRGWQFFGGAGLGSSWLGVLAWSLIFALLFAAGIAALVLLPPLIRRWTGRVSEAAVRRAAQAAGVAGRRQQRGLITACFFGDTPLERTLWQDYEAVSRQLAELAGRPLEPRRPLLVLVFQRRQWFDAYFRGRVPAGGVYWMGGDRQIILCEEASYECLAEPRRIWRLLLARYLFESWKGYVCNSGLASVLGWYVIREMEDAAARRVHRRLRVSLERADPVLARNPLIATDRELARLLVQRGRHESHRLLSLYSAQTCSLAEYLLGPEAGSRAQQFRQFLRDLPSLRRIARCLQEHGLNPQQLVQDWRVWALAQPLEPLDLPPPAVCDFAARQLLPRIADQAAPLDKRCEAIRELGGAGYALGVELLLDLLRQNPPAALRRELVSALESVSGRSSGDDPAAWTAWWEQAKSPLNAGTAAARGEVIDACLAEPLEEESVPVAELADSGTSPFAESPPVAETPAAETPAAEAPTAGAANQGDDQLVERRLKRAWGLMSAGGVLAIVWASYLTIYGNLGAMLWGLFPLLGLISGVFALTRGVGRRSWGLSTAAALQGLCILHGNLLGPIVWIAVRWQLRHPLVQQRLRRQG